jgi:peptidoglycan L-alanyl-D-glutamate endopeptidase CwlK
MPVFGTRSLKCLNTVHDDIDKVLREAIKHYDFSIIEGFRSKEKQEEYYNSGASKLQFPDSKHNTLPSKAVDIVPYPIDWENLNRFHMLARVIKEASKNVEVENLHWGYDLWKWDMPHWELR